MREKKVKLLYITTIFIPTSNQLRWTSCNQFRLPSFLKVCIMPARTPNQDWGSHGLEKWYQPARMIPKEARLWKNKSRKKNEKEQECWESLGGSQGA